MTMNVLSDGMGSWAYQLIDPLLIRTFPNTVITHDASRPPDLVVRSHFTNMERLPTYTCPYICWSGESRPVPLIVSHDPLFELNTYMCERPNSVYLPHLIAEMQTVERPQPNPAKRYCCSYAFSNSVAERKLLFTKMRSLEPTCYAFGRCSFTPDNPFKAPAANRRQNADTFSEFGFNVAMENAIKPGYLTEKIGFAFRSGSVPIYWGDTDTVVRFFNPDAFLNVRDYPNIVSAAKAAVEIWKDRQKLQRYLDAPLTVNTTLADYAAIYTDYRPWQKPMVDLLKDAFPDAS